ncbi:MAG: glycosyltransferase family 4 protein [Clostridia bacterium]|nr:glycosyltransferase family 4 protein [Clostridia bacterium]
MKICYVTTLSVSVRAFFLPQLKYLAENGYEVTVITSPDDVLAADLGEKIRYIPVEIPRGISVFGSLKAIKALKTIFKREKFDLIQYSTPNAAFYASIAAKAVKARVRNYHLMGLRYLGESGLKRKILKFLEKTACKNSTHIECVSPSNLALAEGEGLFPKGKGVVVWNGSSGGLDTERFDFAKRGEYRDGIRKKYGIGEDELVFGFVGRITRDKGVNELLSAFSKTEGARLLMVGSPEGVETLDKELYDASLSDGRIIYTGQVSEVEKYFSAMDVLVFPSYREGFGNVVMEAGAMGTPAIISDIPGPIDAVIAGETALLVPPRDADALLLAMQRMQDASLRERLSTGSATFVRGAFDEKILNKHILDRKNELLGRVTNE